MARDNTYRRFCNPSRQYTVQRYPRTFRALFSFLLYDPEVVEGIEHLVDAYVAERCASNGIPVRLYQGPVWEYCASMTAPKVILGYGRISERARTLFDELRALGVVCDWIPRQSANGLNRITAIQPRIAYNRAGATVPFSTP